MKTIENIVQTDVCGIKWSVLRSSAALSPSPADPLDDPILSAFSRALEVTNRQTDRQTDKQKENPSILTNHQLLN